MAPQKKKSTGRKRIATTGSAGKRTAAGRRVLARASGRSVSHVVVKGSERPVVRGAKRVGTVDPRSQIEVTLTLSGLRLPDADHLPTKSLTPTEFQQQYGVSSADIDAITKSLAKYGLTVSRVLPATRSIKVTGTADQLQNAFRPQLGIYKDASGAEFRDRVGTYQVPKELAKIVTGVIGFGQRRVARRRAAVAKDVAALRPLGPQDVETLYGFPQGTAAQQTIAIAEFGGGFFAEDLANYCGRHGRTVPTVNAIAVDAPAYTLKQILALPDQARKDELDSSVEVMMDVEVIAGLCSNATINVYFSTFDQKGWVDILDRIIQDRPVAISVSWGLAEDDPDWSQAARNAINERLNAAALMGITVCVASGDDGSGDEETDNRCHVDFPASSPFVLGVGGTMIAGAPRPANEVVWWEPPGRRTPHGGGATGGGVSALFPRPSWQKVNIPSQNKGSIVGRVVPDVAAVAGDPLYDLVIMGRDAPNGGTSAAAPVWAALIARINANLQGNKQQRFLAPLLYGSVAGKPLGAQGCTDITSGNNVSHPQPGIGYSAGNGFDAVSGWGTPRGTNLVGLLPQI